MDFDLTTSLKHTRGTGFAIDSVIVTGETHLPTPPPEPLDPVDPVDPPEPPPGDDDEDTDWPISIPPWLADLLDRARPGMRIGFPSLPVDEGDEFPDLPAPLPRGPLPLTPVITSIYPLHGAPGDTVTIHGARLGPSAGLSKVTFGESEPAEIAYADHDRIEVLVPEHATIAPIRIHTRLGTFESPVRFVPLEPSLPWLPAYPHRSWDVSGLEESIGVPFREVHLVGDHRHLAFVLTSEGGIPPSVEMRIRADFQAALRQGPGLENMGTLLSSNEAEEVPEGLMHDRVHDHLTLVVPLSALGPLQGQNNGSFWWMLEVEVGAETAYWPPGPPPSVREHQDMALGAPWYRWDQVVVRGASLERVNEIASAAGGHVIDIVDLEDMDLGIVGVVELAPETTVPHALLAAAELIDEESEDEFMMPSWLLYVGQAPSPVGADFGCPVAASTPQETYRDAQQYNLRPFLPELTIVEPKGTEERGQIADLELSEYGERAFVLRHGTTDPDADVFERARLVSYSLRTAGAPRQHQEPLAADPLFVVRGPTGSNLQDPDSPRVGGAKSGSTSSRIAMESTAACCR